MIRSWRNVAAWFRGWGCGGRGSAPSLAQRFRSRLYLAEHEMLAAIVNRDFARFVLPHQHATAGRRPMLTLPFQLQQPIVVAHHPVLTHHSFLLQPEHFVQLPRRGPSSVIIGCFRRWPCVTPVVLGEIMLVQICIGLLVVGESRPAAVSSPAGLDACRAPAPPALSLVANWRR